MARKALLGTSYVLYLLAIVVAIDYLCYWFYYRDLQQRHRPSQEIAGVPLETWRHVGLIRVDKASSFVKFPRVKPKGVLRIGVFGSSIAFGDEVDEVGDYAHMLAEQIRALGMNAEVINFAVSYSGFFQDYMMWDEIGRQYDLDYIALGPSGFFPDRELYFNHDRGLPYFLHSRYIIENDELRRIDVGGDGYAERFRDYYSFIPAWRYLRYDRSDPAFLAAVLPANTTLGNPFYYDRRSETDEAMAIELRLLRQMLGSGTPIVMGLYADSDSRFDGFAALAGDRFCVARFDRPEIFPYLVVWHNSPAGNAYLAQQYLSMLLGRPVEGLVIRTSDLAPSHLPVVEMPARDLTRYDQIQVELNGVDAGRFALAGPIQPYVPRLTEATSFLRDRAVHSLIALKSSNRGILDSSFLALPDGLDMAAPVRLVWRSGGVAKEVPLGRLRPIAGGLDFAVLDFPGESGDYYHPAFIATATLAHLFGQPVTDGTVQLMLGNGVLLQGAVTAADKMSLQPTRGGLYKLLAGPSGNAAVDRGQATGTADVVLSTQGKAYRLPIAEWRLEQWRVDRSSGCATSRRTLQALKQ